MSTLREFIVTMSENTERYFRVHGRMLPMWHYVNRAGELCLAGQNSPDKDTAAVIMRALFVLEGATRCLFIDEAWIVEGIGKNRDYNERLLAWMNEHGSLKNHPDRIEVVVFEGEDAREGTMIAQRRIIRGRGKPTLGPLEIQDMRGWSASGRLIGMLPRPEGVRVQ